MMKNQRKYFLLLMTFMLCMPFATAQKISTQKGTAYKVVINHEEQYSILPVQMSTPEGWKETKIRGDLKKCNAFIEEVWTDMRPLSVRKQNLPADTRYGVVINHEEQCSILPMVSDIPPGWKFTGVQGDLKKCSKYIEEVWTDMRPLSVRKKGK